MYVIELFAVLSIDPIGSSSGEVSYYATLGEEDYYVRGGEPEGVWWGSGAIALGLHGTVSAEPFRNLLVGTAPDGSKNLVQNAGDSKRRSAFDLTWSVPKSVSAVWSQADLATRKEIEAAAERALYQALDAFDELCSQTRRGHAGARTERAKLVAAIFRHETARGIPGHVPDPNLHWHVVVCNIAVRSDGTTGAYDARPLFQRHMKMTLGALFRAELSKQLEQLGLTSHRPEKDRGQKASWFELDVVPAELVAELSKRRQEIEKWLRKNGLTGAKAAELAALKTRQDKQHISREELFGAWQKVGGEFGLTSDVLMRHIGTPTPVRSPETEIQDAVSLAIKRITDDRSHFSQLELLRFTAEEAQSRGLGIEEVVAGVRRAIQQSPEIVTLAEIEDARHYTTREMLELERRILDAVKRAVGNSTHALSPDHVADVISFHRTLRGDQIEALRHITLAHERVTCVNGFAGTGKTFMLSVANEAWQRAGFEVVGTALSASAAKTLQAGSSIESTHLDRLFWELDKGKRSLTASSIIVLDEAGMVGTRKMEKLIAITERAGAKLVLVGDHRQLQAIEAGAPFKGIAERIGCAELTKITRQRERWARTAVTEFAQGYAAEALLRYVERGLLVISDDRDEACAKLVSDWEACGQSDKRIFVGTRLEARTINRLCQQSRLTRGELGEACITCGPNDLHVGDRVLFTKNKTALLLRNGSTGTVTGIVPQTRTIRVRLDDGFQIQIGVDSYDHIELGYALTTHKGQGQTVDKAFVLAGGPMTDREITYVQSSRARGETKIYTDAVTGGEDIVDLARQMSRSRAKDLAHDYLLEGQ